MDLATHAVDIGLLALRVIVGVGVSLHGMQKLFGWFNGGGFAGTSRWFASLGFGDGRVATAMAGSTEIAGGLGLAVGLLTPLASLGLIGVMTTAALVNARDHGFWSANKGWELNLYLIAVAAALAVTGPGAFSLDALLGLTWLAGPVSGGAIVVLGVSLGALRWVTRQRVDGER